MNEITVLIDFLKWIFILVRNPVVENQKDREMEDVSTSSEQAGQSTYQSLVTNSGKLVRNNCYSLFLGGVHSHTFSITTRLQSTCYLGRDRSFSVNTSPLSLRDELLVGENSQWCYHSRESWSLSDTCHCVYVGTPKKLNLHHQNVIVSSYFIRKVSACIPR